MPNIESETGKTVWTRQMYQPWKSKPNSWIERTNEQSGKVHLVMPPHRMVRLSAQERTILRPKTNPALECLPQFHLSSTSARPAELEEKGHPRAPHPPFSNLRWRVLVCAVCVRWSQAHRGTCARQVMKKRQPGAGGSPGVDVVAVGHRWPVVTRDQMARSKGVLRRWIVHRGRLSQECRWSNLRPEGIKHRNPLLDFIPAPPSLVQQKCAWRGEDSPIPVRLLTRCLVCWAWHTFSRFGFRYQNDRFFGPEWVEHRDTFLNFILPPLSLVREVLVIELKLVNVASDDHPVHRQRSQAV